MSAFDDDVRRALKGADAERARLASESAHREKLIDAEISGLAADFMELAGALGRAAVPTRFVVSEWGRLPYLADGMRAPSDRRRKDPAPDLLYGWKVASTIILGANGIALLGGVLVDLTVAASDPGFQYVERSWRKAGVDFSPGPFIATTNMGPLIPLLPGTENLAERLRIVVEGGEVRYRGIEWDDPTMDRSRWMKGMAWTAARQGG